MPGPRDHWQLSRHKPLEASKKIKGNQNKNSPSEEHITRPFNLKPSWNVLTQVLRLNTLEPVLFKMNEIKRLQRKDPANAIAIAPSIHLSVLWTEPKGILISLSLVAQHPWSCHSIPECDWQCHRVRLGAQVGGRWVTGGSRWAHKENCLYLIS